MFSRKWWSKDFSSGTKETGVARRVFFFVQTSGQKAAKKRFTNPLKTRKGQNILLFRGVRYRNMEFSFRWSNYDGLCMSKAMHGFRCMGKSAGIVIGFPNRFVSGVVVA